MSQSGEQRIKKAQSGNEAALAELLSEHYEFIYLYLLKVTMKPELAQDLTQETMTKAILNIRSYKSKKAKFSTWLIQIGTNLWLDTKRKEKRERSYSNNQQLDWSLRHVNDDAWIDVKDALLKLKDLYRIPILLKHYYGYSYDEISLICQIRAGTAKSRIHAGMDQLRKELEYD
ncbi:RNA polymerase sigma-70 factor (ECF subfamily) [Alkalihalobacillus xiaoxiensis]|uniref:RNA polymerase sigma-70 factor (ECF subfamily) n=1 Tax=Shouchella xiaoxiensis TaxID=766895 RepID=A0ABS2SPE1_9BACI|nr:sigma-70 family RNA polymerase sigma factor [Shouchella xiaoxiensis]MBM7837396.1 RNA polymerase sigma-70 factor (ECF subfamily) [Shouchella xiaoxiensis]